MAPTPERLEKMRRVASGRTRRYVFVLEDLNDPHNISAILRTCECFGLHEIHVIEELRPFRISKPIVKGADSWLDIRRWTSRQECLQHLRDRGYRIAVASSRAEKAFHECDLEPPTAIYLGTEFQGNSEHIYQNADVVFRLQQRGFTESLNVSVCAGMMVAILDRHMSTNGHHNYVLSSEDQAAVVQGWVEAHGRE